MKIPIALTILSFIISPVQSAIIKGNVYSWELNKISAIVEINTTPKQRIVAVNGSYEFSVPAGTYMIRAYSTDGELSCNETIVITSNGTYITYILDLILFPTLKYGELNFTEPSFEIEEENNQTILILIILTAVFVIFIVKKRSKSPDNSELPEDLTHILKILKESGGRVTQKELREKTRWSEAKLSLVLTDLERRGLIEKYRKGRGNVIFLK